MKPNPIRVLLVEDNPGDVRLIQEMFAEGKGWNGAMEYAESLAAGLLRIARGGIDVVLLDLGLPDSAGLDTLRRLHAGAPQAPVVVVMSGINDEEVGMQAVQEGAQDYLVKGQVSSGLLIRSIRYAIERNEAEKALLQARDKLDSQVRERTAKLAQAIESLEKENAERRMAEEALRQLNTELDRRVLDRTAQLEATNKELEGFVYSISHDLRAPLRHIDGFIELMKQTVGTNVDKQIRHYMACISDAAQKMGRLIEGLLSFSRMGRHAVTFQQVNLGNLVRDIINEIEPDTVGRNINWRIGDLPVVSGDVAMLRTVLVNLISNAIKFTRPVQQAEIEIDRLPDTKTETIVFVRDNGVGFDMNYADKLFNVFQRLHYDDEFEGTGIGLANVRRIIARHGGRTWAEGKMDQGATFYFSLPLA